MAKKKYKPKPFEAMGEKFINRKGNMQADTSANIYESMLQSQSFQLLTPKQALLYVYMKSQYYGKAKPKKDYPGIPEFQDDDLFYFSWQQAKDYGLYKQTCNKNFRNDVEALIKHGFIERVVSGKSNKKKTVYRYSAKWKEQS